MTEKETDRINHKSILSSTQNRKIYLSIIAASVATLMTYGITTIQPSTAQNTQAMNPTAGYDVHVTVNRHDSENLNAAMDHYCKLDKRIVAVCQLYAKDNNAKPGTGPQLAQIEFIITKDAYMQLPPRERSN